MNLLKTSLIISFIGILFLLTLYSFPPKLTELSQLDNSQLNKLIKTKGKITDIQEKNNFFILTIKDNSAEIQVISNKNFPINKTIEVTGKLELYKDKLQVRGERIEVID